jgi:serine/threonine protein kinase
MTSVSQDGPLRIGETFLGKYEIRKFIGRGGFARVYHGINHFMGSHVAIKVIWRPGGVDKDAQRRGQAEAQILNQLRHENIVQIIDAGMTDGLLYIVMELLDGRSLRELLLEHRRLSVEEVLALAAQIAGGVHAAHEIGVIHRDLKPENVYVRADNRVKVLDFGIAKLSGGASWTTQKGMAHGTAFYMSPEQIQDLPLTPASDMYSLGIIMYEALIGHHPIRALLPSASPNIWAVAHIVINKELPLLDAVDPRVPHAVAAVVKRAIHKEPKSRFGSMKEFAAALRECRTVWLAFAEAHGVPITDRDLSQPSSETGRVRASSASSRQPSAEADAHDTEPFSRPLFLGAISSGTLDPRRAPAESSPAPDGREALSPAAPDDDLTPTNRFRLPSSVAHLVPNDREPTDSAREDSHKQNHGPRHAPARSQPKSAVPAIQINAAAQRLASSFEPPTPTHRATPALGATAAPLGPMAIPGVRAIGPAQVLLASVAVGLALAAGILYLRPLPLTPSATPARAATSTITMVPANDVPLPTTPVSDNAAPAPPYVSEPATPAPIAHADAEPHDARLQDVQSLAPLVPNAVAPEAAPVGSTRTKDISSPRARAPKVVVRSPSKSKPIDPVDARMQQLARDLAATEAPHSSSNKGTTKRQPAPPETGFFPPLD